MNRVYKDLQSYLCDLIKMSKQIIPIVAHISVWRQSFVLEVAYSSYSYSRITNLSLKKKSTKTERYDTKSRIALRFLKLHIFGKKYLNASYICFVPS